MVSRSQIALIKAICERETIKIQCDPLAITSTHVTTYYGAIIKIIFTLLEDDMEEPEEHTNSNGNEEPDNKKHKTDETDQWCSL